MGCMDILTFLYTRRTFRTVKFKVSFGLTHTASFLSVFHTPPAGNHTPAMTQAAVAWICAVPLTTLPLTPQHWVGITLLPVMTTGVADPAAPTSTVWFTLIPVRNENLVSLNPSLELQDPPRDSGRKENDIQV